MSVNLASLKLTDPLVIKAGGGAALYAFGGSRTARMIGLALMGWAAWDYFKPAAKAPATIPYDPDAPLPLEKAVTSSPTPSADPFKGTRWENSPLAPSVRPLRPGETAPGAKVIPIRPPTPEERAMFYGINPEPGDNVG